MKDDNEDDEETDDDNDEDDDEDAGTLKETATLGIGGEGC